MEVLRYALDIAFAGVASGITWAIKEEIPQRIRWKLSGKTRKTFNQACKDISKLEKQMRREASVLPDYIIGVDGGGYLVAALLSGKLKKDMLTLDTERDEFGKILGVKALSLERLKGIEGKNVLLVDDDSGGNGLKIVKEAIEKMYKCNSLEIAVLSRRTDVQLNRPHGPRMTTRDYKFAINPTKEPVQYPWNMFWSP